MIVSFFFTFLCFDGEKLYQKNICDILDEEKFCTINDLEKMGYEIVKSGDKYLSFKINNTYLSANPNLTMTNKAHILAWEMFRIVSPGEFKKVIKLPESMVISKEIHQTNSSDIIHDTFLQNIESMKMLSPDYKYNYYSPKDRIDFIYGNFGWDVLNLYLRINNRYGAAKADLFRYLCIYKNGGVYLDMKSGTETPFSDIIKQDDKILLSHWDSIKSKKFHGWGRGIEISHIPNGEFMQWFVIANAGNKILQKVINQVMANIYLYDENIHGTGRYATFFVTGPYAYTRAISCNLTLENHRIIDAENLGLIYNNVENYKRITDYRTLNTPLVL